MVQPGDRSQAKLAAFVARRAQRQGGCRHQGGNGRCRVPWLQLLAFAAWCPVIGFRNETQSMCRDEQGGRDCSAHAGCGSGAGCGGGTAAGLQQAVVEVHDDEAAVRVDLSHLPFLRRPPHPVLQVGPRPRPELLCTHPTCRPLTTHPPPAMQLQRLRSCCSVLGRTGRVHICWGCTLIAQARVARQHGLHRTQPQMRSRSDEGWWGAALWEPSLVPWCAQRATATGSAHNSATPMQGPRAWKRPHPLPCPIPARKTCTALWTGI